jgi:hypothetical protein
MMDDEGDQVWRDWVAFNRRRADEERGKADAARTDHARACHLVIADIFDARAKGGPVPTPALPMVPTLH